MSKGIIAVIHFYQRYLSFDRGLLRIFGQAPACRFSPTCSEYFIQAVLKYGILAGSLQGVKRILRCSPASRGGFDPLI